jgi:hypothetical protein
MSNTPKTVYVIYYSMYGHIQTLAREVVKGLERSGGIFYTLNCHIISFFKQFIFKWFNKVNAKLFQVQETLPQQVKLFYLNSYNFNINI